MTETYYAKIKNYKNWELIHYHNGMIFNDNAEEIHADWIEKEYPLKDIYHNIKNAISSTPVEDTVMQEACKDFITQAFDYFNN